MIGRINKINIFLVSQSMRSTKTTSASVKSNSRVNSWHTSHAYSMLWTQNRMTCFVSMGRADMVRIKKRKFIISKNFKILGKSFLLNVLVDKLALKNIGTVVTASSGWKKDKIRNFNFLYGKFSKFRYRSTFAPQRPNCAQRIRSSYWKSHRHIHMQRF